MLNMEVKFYIFAIASFHSQDSHCNVGYCVMFDFTLFHHVLLFCGITKKLVVIQLSIVVDSKK